MDPLQASGWQLIAVWGAWWFVGAGRGRAPLLAKLIGGFMRPLRRGGANKHRHAKSFKRNVSRTHPKNVKPMPMRGGWRL